MKRLAHKRWPKGHHMCRGKYDQKYASWYEQFKPGKWYDISYADALVRTPSEEATKDTFFEEGEP
jgi:hypothetical protein